MLPWGECRNLRLPQGLNILLDFFQQKLSCLCGDLDCVKAFVDDILIVLNGSCSDHLTKVNEVFERLSSKNMQANLTKSHFAQSEIEHLGFVLTQDGAKPQPKKVKAMLDIAPPKNKCKLHRCCYQCVWKLRSHTSAPLTELTKKDAK